MRVADDHRDTGQLRDLVGYALSVAAGNYYFAARIVSAKPANGGPSVLFGGSSDGTDI